MSAQAARIVELETLLAKSAEYSRRVTAEINSIKRDMYDVQSQLAGQVDQVWYWSDKYWELKELLKITQGVFRAGSDVVCLGKERTQVLIKKLGTLVNSRGIHRSLALRRHNQR